MKTLRDRATKLRIEGYSYAMISKRLNIPKSTLSDWLGKIPFKPNKALIKRVGEAKLRSALYKNRLKLENIVKMKTEARADIGMLSPRDLFMLGIGLYLGEGAKSQEEVRIVNADPKILRLAIAWLVKFGKIEPKHVRIAIHGYPDHDVGTLVSFWSRALDIPSSQFIKTNIDIRENKLASKKRKLPYGTAHLYVRGGGTLPLGVKNLHRKIMGWIESSMSQI